VNLDDATVSGSMSPWQPTEITEQIESFGTSTYPIHIMTDAGEAVLKYIGNPKGPGVIANDWLGNVIAKMLGLTSLEQAIIEVTPQVARRLRPTGSHHVLSGLAMVTKWIEMNPWDGTEQTLASTSGIGDLGTLVTFDTLIMNPDRHEDCLNPIPQEDLHQNMDNLGIGAPNASGGRDLVVFDHGEAFNRSRALMVLTQSVIESPQIYGVFPAFRRYLRMSQIEAACQRLLGLDWNAIDAEIDGMPNAWCLGTFRKEDAKRLLKARAPWLAATLPTRIHPYTADAQQRVF
jgi:hypothetical protein